MTKQNPNGMHRSQGNEATIVLASKWWTCLTMATALRNYYSAIAEIPTYGVAPYRRRIVHVHRLVNDYYFLRRHDGDVAVADIDLRQFAINWLRLTEWDVKIDWDWRHRKSILSGTCAQTNECTHDRCSIVMKATPTNPFRLDNSEAIQIQGIP